MRTTAVFVLYAAAAVGGSYLVFRPTIDAGFARTQMERGDGLLNHYILENSWLALTDPGYRGTLLSPPMFFPERYTIYYSENLFGSAPLYWALRPGLPAERAYPWWQVLLGALNFASFALAARWLKLPHVLAAGGAFFWAFALVHADQVKHQQMIGRFWMPPGVYYAAALVAGPSARSLNRLLACIFLQSLTCVYTGWFLVAGLAAFVPALVWLRPGAWAELKRFRREHMPAVTRIVGGWGLAMGVLFVPYLLVNWGIGRSYEEAAGLMPTPSAWLSGPPGSLWLERLAPYRAPVGGECWLFCGFTVYALAAGAAVGLLSWPRAERPAERAVCAAALVAAAAWVLLTLTPHDGGESAWRVLRYAPGGLAIRCVARVYTIVYLFGSLAGLLWLAHATARVRRGWVRLAVQALVVGLMAGEQVEMDRQSFAQATFYPLVDRTAEDLRGAAAGYVIPFYPDPTDSGPTDGVYGDVFGMWVGMRANVPVLNGYSGRAPDNFPSPGPLTDEQIRGWLKGKFHGTVRVVDATKPGERRDVIVE
jgi:hypothetical protein